jgi:hypothetical protein
LRVTEQIRLTVEELPHVPTHIHLRALDPGLDGRESTRRARGRKAREVPLTPQPVELEPEAIECRQLGPEARIGCGPEKQANGAAVGERCELMESSEVDVTRRYGQAVFRIDVPDQICERLIMARIESPVIEQVRALVHGASLPGETGA